MFVQTIQEKEKDKNADAFGLVMHCWFDVTESELEVAKTITKLQILIYIHYGYWMLFKELKSIKNKLK